MKSANNIDNKKRIQKSKMGQAAHEKGQIYIYMDIFFYNNPHHTIVKPGIASVFYFVNLY